jgi:hypothetical protein
VGRLSDVHARLSCFPDIVGRIETLHAELAAVAADAPHATLVRLWCTYGADAGRYLPLSLAPILDRALIGEGIAAGWHSAPPHDAVPAELRDGDGRLLMGRLIHAAKQYDAPMWSTDVEDVQAIGSLAAFALATTRFGRDVDLVASVPSSRGTNALPHQVARDLSFLTGIRYAPADAIRFGRQVPQIKELRDYWTKRETIDGSMEADAAAFRGRGVLLVDDVCRSGATLHECARACHRAGAIRVTALAVSKTWEFQRIPMPRFDEDARWGTAP